MGERYTIRQREALAEIEERSSRHLHTFYRGDRTHDSLVRRGVCRLSRRGSATIIGRIESENDGTE